MRKEEKTSALIISIVNCFRINLESINQIVRAAKAGGSISKHSTNYQFHAVARFLAKLTPTDGRTDTIDRATATINSSLKSAAEMLAVNVTYRPRPLALPANIVARYEKASGPDTSTDVEECFFASGNRGAFVFEGGAFCFPGNM